MKMNELSKWKTNRQERWKKKNICSILSRHLQCIHADMKMIGKRASGTTIIYYIAFLTYINVTEIADVYVYINIVSLNLIRDLSSKNEKERSSILKRFFFDL